MSMQNIHPAPRASINSSMVIKGAIFLGGCYFFPRCLAAMTSTVSGAFTGFLLNCAMVAHFKKNKKFDERRAFNIGFMPSLALGTLTTISSVAFLGFGPLKIFFIGTGTGLCSNIASAVYILSTEKPEESR